LWSWNPNSDGDWLIQTLTVVEFQPAKERVEHLEAASRVCYIRRSLMTQKSARSAKERVAADCDGK
jgi:hypothetical protein